MILHPDNKIQKRKTVSNKTGFEDCLTIELAKQILNSQGNLIA